MCVYLSYLCQRGSAHRAQRGEVKWAREADTTKGVSTCCGCWAVEQAVVWVHICVSMCMYVCEHACVCEWTWMCVWTCECVCGHACVYMHTCTSVCRVQVRMCVCAYACACEHVCVYSSYMCIDVNTMLFSDKWVSISQWRMLKLLCFQLPAAWYNPWCLGLVTDTLIPRDVA